MRDYLFLAMAAIAYILFLLWLTARPAPARDYCPPPPQAALVQMRGTGYCPRIPTVPKPYCPWP